MDEENAQQYLDNTELAWLRRFASENAKDLKISSDEASRLVQILQFQLQLQLDPSSARSSQIAPSGTDESEEICLHAAKAAAKLAQNEDNRGKLASGGLVPILLGLLKIITDEAQIEELLFALHPFSQMEQHHKAMLKAGVVEPLLGFCCFKAKGLQAPAAHIVSALAQAETSWPLLMKAGLTRALVHLLHSKSQRAKTAAAATTAKLTTEHAHQLTLGRAGVIPLLVPLLQRGPEHLQAAAGLALQNLSCAGENKARVADSGAFPLLVKRLQTGTAPMQEAAAGALMNLAYDPAFHLQLMAADAVRALSVSLGSRVEMVQGYAAGFFMNFSTCEASHVHVIEASKDLIQQSIHSPNPEVRKWAAAAVWNLIKPQMLPVLVGEVPLDSGECKPQNSKSSALGTITPDFKCVRKSLGAWMKKQTDACTRLLMKTGDKSKTSKSSKAHKINEEDKEGKDDRNIEQGKEDKPDKDEKGDKGCVVNVEASPA